MRRCASRRRYAIATLLVAAGMLMAGLQFAAMHSSGGFALDLSERVIVGYRYEKDLSRLLSAVRENGGEVRGINHDIASFVVTGLGGKEKVSSILSSIAPLKYVEDDSKSFRVMLNPSDPYYYTRQWAPQQIEANFAWDITLGSKSIVVAVLDSGIDYNHEDLAANMWTDDKGYHGYDFVNGDPDPMDDQNLFPNSMGICEPNPVYHGTHVVGIIGAVTNNDRGIAGLAQVSLMAVKVTDSCGRGSIWDITQGITYAANQGARVISLSLGGSDYSVLRNAIQYAWEKGAVIVAASGNNGAAVVSYPAAYPSVIGVGSTDRYNRRSTFSSYGIKLSLVAPGEDIYSCMVTPPYYQSHTGTSPAAPQVAGVAALVLSRNPALTNSEVRAILNSTATDLGDPGWDVEYGYGLVNAYDAVRAALPGGMNASIVTVDKVEGTVGDTVMLSATLKDPDENPVVGRQLQFSVDTAYVGSATTDSNGIGRITYQIPNAWGQHEIRVSFAGDSSYTPSSASGMLLARGINGGDIVGVILSQETNERIPFSEVSLPQAGITITTDERADFLIAGVPSGVWTLTADHFGFVRAYVNVTVQSNKTTVVPILLGTGGGSLPPPESLALVTGLSLVTMVALVSVLFYAAFRSSRRRASNMGRWKPPDGVPPHVSEWLMNVQGIDASRLIPIEMMPIAEGHQLALLDPKTGHLVVVRLNRLGQPAYVSSQ